MASYKYSIIGGGLAGLTLAIRLSKAGEQVCLIEKKGYPRHKVCGEYVSLESWDFLERIGIPLSELQLPIVTQLHLTHHQGLSFKSALDLGGFGISRYLLEDLLYKKALSQGVTFIFDQAIDHQKYPNYEEISLVHSEKIQAGRVIFAYGKSTHFQLNAKAKASQRWFAMKWHVKSQEARDTIGLHFFKGGYVGTSAIEDGKNTICLMATQESLKAAGGNTEAFLDQHLRHGKYTAQLWQAEEWLYDKPLIISNISFSRTYPTETDQFYMGDAAGMIAPLSGNGMSMAFYAAHRLAELLLHSPQKTSTEIATNYQKEWSKAFGLRLKIGNILQNSSLVRGAVPSLILLGKVSPPILKWLISHTHGKSF